MNYEKTIDAVDAALRKELERLSAIDVGADSATELALEIQRSKAIEGTAHVAIENVAAAVATQKALGDALADGAPRLLEG